MVQRNPDELNVGGYGGKHLGPGDETEAGARIGCIMPYEDMTLSSVAESDQCEAPITGDVLTGVTWPAGIPIFGDWKYLKLASGRAIAYNYRSRVPSP